MWSISSGGERPFLHRDDAKRGTGQQRGGGAEHVVERGDHVGGGDRIRRSPMFAERNARTQRHQEDRAEDGDHE